MKISPSTEMYMKTIYQIYKEKGNVRSIDIATELNFSKPTISIAMKKFNDEGLIEMEYRGNIKLTQKGIDVALDTCRKHDLIARALLLIGVSPDTVAVDSCLIEHCISEETFECIRAYVEKKDGVKSYEADN